MSKQPKFALTLLTTFALMSVGTTALAQQATPASPATPDAGMHRMGGERHPAMLKARRNLVEARTALQHAAHDFQGHRSRAIQLIDQAIHEIDLGIQSDRK